MTTELNADNIILLKQELQNILERLINNKYIDYEKKSYILFNILNSIEIVKYFNIIDEIFIDFINKSIKIIDKKFIITNILFIFYHIYLLKLNTKKYILYTLNKLIDLVKIEEYKYIIDINILSHITEIDLLNLKRSKHIVYFNTIERKFVIKYKNDDKYSCNFLFKLKIIKYLKYLKYDSLRYDFIIEDFKYYLYNDIYIITPLLEESYKINNILYENTKTYYEYEYDSDEDIHESYNYGNIIYNNEEISEIFKIKEIDIKINNQIRKICYLFEPKLVWISSVIRAQESKKMY